MVLAAAEAITAAGEQFRLTVREFGLWVAVGLAAVFLLWKFMDMRGKRKGE